LRYERDTGRHNSAAISRPVISASLLFVCCNQSGELKMDKLRIIRTQMGITIDQKMVAVAWDALYDTTP
jgi:hypothetical protein